MLKITIIAVGKAKEKYLSDGYSEYIKRLSGYCNLNIVELAPTKADEGSPASIAAAIENEGDRILAKIPARALVLPLCIEGKQMPSVALAELMKSTANSGTSEVCFIIGGSYGLSDRVKKMGKIKFSMSEMTFPHQLARLMLLEQIYRAFKINEGGNYHK